MADPHWGPVEQQPEAYRARKKHVSRRRRYTLRALKAVGIVTALGLISMVAIVFIGYRTTDRPDPNADFETATTFVYYNDGKSQLGTFAVQNRQPVESDQIAENMKQAIVAAENRTFWTDKGISIRGMIRAAWTIARGGTIQGGSTITQQYIKILYLTSDQTLTRKFRELFLAYKINKEMSKDEILEGYLNTIYFGHGAYGIQAASQAYFKTDANDLTVPQSAFLSTVVNNPSLYDPSDEDNTERILKRYRYVIWSMGETGYLTPAAGERVQREAAQVSQGQGQRALRRPQGLPAQDGRTRARSGRLRLLPGERRRAQGHHHLRQGRPGRGGGGGPEVHQGGRERRGSQGLQAARGRGLGRRGQWRGARALRRPRLRRELPQLGHHRPARPPRPSRRTRWPPVSRRATASTPRSTGTPSPRPATPPRSATSTPTSTARPSP